MGSVYRPMRKGGNLPEGVSCTVPAHGKADTCPGCGARFATLWWAQYYVNGKRVRRSTRKAKKKEARGVLRRWEGNPEAYPKAADRIAFEDLAQGYLRDYEITGKRSVKRAREHVAHLRRTFAGWRPANIAPAVPEYVVRRQGEGASNGTINRELAALKRMFRLAEQAGQVARVPYIALLKEDNVRTGFFSEADYLALREALPAHLRPPVDFAYTYGWRRGEVFGLTWDRVDLVAGTVRLEPGSTKNREGRQVKLTPPLHDLLWELRAQTPPGCPWVFHRRGKPIGSFRKAWEAACTKAKLPGRLFHDLRRTALRNMLPFMHERVAMRITGHKTRSAFDRYHIVTQVDVDEAVARMAGVTGTPAGTPSHPVIAQTGVSRAE